MPDLLEIENIASDTPDRTVTLSGISVTVLFSLLTAGARISDWWVDNAPLNQIQIDKLDAWLAGAYKELMVSQIGQIKISAGSSIPDGCLLCDGTAYERVDYPELYAAIAPAFIVDADNFVVPDLREKFVYGVSDLGEIGTTGGAPTHTLTAAEIPSHSHTIPLTTTTLAVEPGEVAVLSPIPILTDNTGDTGGGGSHNNIPPFVQLALVIVAV